MLQMGSFDQFSLQTLKHLLNFIHVSHPPGFRWTTHVGKVSHVIKALSILERVGRQAVDTAHAGRRLLLRLFLIPVPE